MIGSVRQREHSYHCCPTIAAVAFDYLLIAAAGRFLSLFLHFFTDHQVPALEKNFHLWGMVVPEDYTQICHISASVLCIGKRILQVCHSLLFALQR